MLRAIVRSLAVGSAVFAVLAPTASTARVPPSFLLQSVKPPTSLRPDSALSGGLLNQWRHQRDWEYQGWQGVAQSYAAALSFARCAAKMNPDSIALIERPIGAPGDRESLARFVHQNRACVGEQSAVSPLLIRVALAETAMAGGVDLPSARVPIGVPEIVDGYPLAAVARCLVQKSPESVAAVLRTRPGDEAERVAAQTLFGQSPECAGPQTLRLTPTAARLALVDAFYRRANADVR